MTQDVLLVDDDPVQRRLLCALVERLGMRPVPCDNGAAALEVLRLARPDRRPGAMVLDLAMPGLSGGEVMAEMRRLGLDVPVIVQTGAGGIDTAVEAMRSGAFDFLVKPASPERLGAVLTEAVRVSRARERHARNRPPRSDAFRLEAASSAMRPVVKQAGRAAASSIPVHIEGETGVGKEWLAMAIRAAGPRARKPFVAVNCAALPRDLAESILFGHAKGAFTGAAEKRPGKFAEADGGTLFLDEVGDLPPDVQGKLLRVLQDGKVDPVGGSGAIAVDARVLSATNRDLEAAVAAGRFREDLFYRLDVLRIRVPPLRERREEIAPLARRLLADICAATRGERPLALAPDAIARLQDFDWPGNVRQLENALHRAAVLTDGDTLTAADFAHLVSRRGGAPAMGATPLAGEPDAKDPPRRLAGPQPSSDAAGVGAEPTLAALGTDGEIRRAEDVEADLIRLAIRCYGGRMSEVARRLGIGRSTLYRKLRDYGIDDRRPLAGDAHDGLMVAD